MNVSTKGVDERVRDVSIDEDLSTEGRQRGAPVFKAA